MHINKDKKDLACSNLNTNNLPASADFLHALDKKGMLLDLYKKAEDEFKSNVKINIINNGLIIDNMNKILFYLIKDKETEDKYLGDISKIECIDHAQYDKDNTSLKTYNSNSTKYEKMTGLKNRATALESLVNFYFKELNFLQLPDLIFNLSYTNEKSNINKEINLYHEFDGCYLYEGENNINFESLKFFVPFNSEKRYLITESKIIDVFEEKPAEHHNQIYQKSLLFIEVKTRFPLENDSNYSQKLESVIQNMLHKLSYFLEIYLNILNKNKIETIQFLLLYNHNRLCNYKEIIKTYLNNNKSEIKSKIKQYKIYLDLLYIFPSIGNISLNLINKKLNQLIKETKESKTQMQKMEKENKENLKKMEKENEEKQKKMKKENEENLKKIKKESEEKQKKLEDQNKKSQEQIEKLEEENKNGMQRMKELEEKLKKLEEFIKNIQINKNKENKKQEDQKEIHIIENKKIEKVNKVIEKVKIFDKNANAKEKEN